VVKKTFLISINFNWGLTETF